MKTKVILRAIIFLGVIALYSHCSGGGRGHSPSEGTDEGYSYTSKGIALFDQEGDKDALDTYTSWKTTYLTDNGASGFLRVQRTENSNDTVSEGIGYGMILAVYFNDRTTFDGLWSYAKSHLNDNGLMKWHIDASGAAIDSGAATDADEDMALALVFADKKWGGYETDVKALLGNILLHETETDGLLKPGDMWNSPYPVNPSYIAPAWYRVFRDYTGDARWTDVLDRNYEALLACQDPATGLVPDWCNPDGSEFSGKSHAFGYDACRTPWRVSIDYLWNHDSRARAFIAKMSAFFKTKGAAAIVSGYDLGGADQVAYLDAAFAGPIACLVCASDLDEKFKDQLYARFMSVGSGNYFNQSLKALATLVTSGNFPNLMKDPVPILNTTMPAYIDYYNWTTTLPDAADDVLRRTPPVTGTLDPDYDVSFNNCCRDWIVDRCNCPNPGVLKWVVSLPEESVLFGLAIDNMTDSDNQSTIGWNYMTSFRVLAISSGKNAEYVYDSTGCLHGSGAGLDSNRTLFVQFAKPVRASKLRLELASSRHGCHVKLLGVYKNPLNYASSSGSGTYSVNSVISLGVSSPYSLSGIICSWKQISGPATNPDDLNGAVLNFNADTAGDYVFRTTVSDGFATKTIDSTVHILQ